MHNSVQGMIVPIVYNMLYISMYFFYFIGTVILFVMFRSY